MQSAARMEKRNVFKILTSKLIGNELLEGLGVNVRIILEWILKKYVSV